jgi:hypothetical protein
MKDEVSKLKRAMQDPPVPDWLRNDLAAIHFALRNATKAAEQAQMAANEAQSSVAVLQDDVKRISSEANNAASEVRP